MSNHDYPKTPWKFLALVALGCTAIYVASSDFGGADINPNMEPPAVTTTHVPDALDASIAEGEKRAADEAEACAAIARGDRSEVGYYGVCPSQGSDTDSFPDDDPSSPCYGAYAEDNCDPDDFDEDWDAPDELCVVARIDGELVEACSDF